jgi:hypothetical protein
MADHMRTELVSDALRMAIESRHPAPGLIFHSDRGTQYTAGEYRRLLDLHQVTQSFSRPRQCWDNAVAESWFSTLKTELIHRQSWATRAQVRRAVFEYIEVWYNRRRLHSSLNLPEPDGVRGHPPGFGQGGVVNPVRDDGATTCGVCGTGFHAVGRQRHCSTLCRQTAWRRRRAAPVEPVVAKADTVYECDGCGERYIGQQRCEICNLWCRRVGPGGCCPHCDDAVALNDLIDPAQLGPRRLRSAATTP